MTQNNGLCFFPALTFWLEILLSLKINNAVCGEAFSRFRSNGVQEVKWVAFGKCTLACTLVWACVFVCIHEIVQTTEMDGMHKGKHQHQNHHPKTIHHRIAVCLQFWIIYISLWSFGLNVFRVRFICSCVLITLVNGASNEISLCVCTQNLS